MPDPAAVRSLHRIRVLLVSRDRRFLRVTALLFRQCDCSVEVAERPSELIDRIATQRTNVVVLDGSDSLTDTARAMTLIEALTVGVVSLVVYDGAESPPLRNLSLLSKWGAFEELLDEVQRAYSRAGQSEVSDAAI